VIRMSEKKNKFLNQTTITTGWKIALVKSVREILEKDEGEVRIGDRLGFYQNDRGEIVLRRM